MTEARGYEIYSIGDSAASGLRAQFEYQSSPNLALAASGLPILRTAVAHNETGHTLADITVAGSFEFGQALPAEFSITVAGPHSPSSTINIPLDSVVLQATVAAFQQSVEAVSGSIKLRVTASADAGSALPPIEISLTLPVRVLPGNEFLNWPELHASLATFLRPNSRSLTPILRAASDLLLEKTKSGALEGYQAGPVRAQQIAGALYEAMRGKQLTYINPPASFEFTGQKVRTIDQVLNDRFGTCIDLAVVYAAAVEAVGLFPVLFITNGHAFAGYYADGQFGDATVVHDPNVIANLVESGAVIPVELTGINPGSKVSFRAAVKLARDYVRSDFDRLRSMVDVPRCRLSRILPLPSLEFERPAGMSAEQVQASDDDRPFVVRASLKSLTLDSDDEQVVGALDLTDRAPTRIKNWKRDLLDLSLRNPLLNLPRNGKALDLLVPAGLLAKIDDAIHAGRKLTVLPADGVDEVAQQRGIRAASELDPATVTEAFTLTRSLYGAVDGTAFVRKLRTLQRDAETLEQETGSNYLYLALGSLVHPKAGGGEARAPLFLLPVRLRGNPIIGYRFEADPGEFAIPNLCLVEWLRVTKGVRFPALENPPTDDSGIAMTTVLAELRRGLLEKNLPYRIDETATLAILRFSTFQIWRDLDQNWEALINAPIVEHLVNRPGETFVDPFADVPVAVDEASRRLAVPVDGSQLTAISRALTGQSFVLEGPPGTGKSQTITNLIAELMRDGKTVLFVAEKQAALEVVQRRLNAIGLGRFTLQLHGEKQSVGSIRAQLKASLDVPRSALPSSWASDSARLAAVITELEEYPDRVHSRNPFGLSLWEAHEQLASLGEGPVAQVPSATLRSGVTQAEAISVVEEFALAASRAGIRRGNPWALVGAGFGPGIEVERLSPVLDRLSAAADAVAALSPDFGRLLSAIDPVTHLGHAAYLASRQAVGAVATQDLAAASAAGWNDRVAAFRTRIAEFNGAHTAVTAHASEALYAASDLGDLHARSQQLDKSWLFRESRRKPLRARLGELTSAEWAATLPGEQLTPFIGDAITAAAASAQLSRDVASTPGLRLPESWAPWGQAALADFDAAVATSRSAAALSGAVGADGVLRLIALADNERAWLIEIAAAWRDWLAAIHASELSMDAWTGGQDWVAAWRAAQPQWRSDLDASGTLRPQRAALAAEHAAKLSELGLRDFAVALQSGAVEAPEAVSALMRGAAAASATERISANLLGDFDREREDGISQSYSTLIATSRASAARELANTLIERRPFDPQNLRGEVAELRRQIDRKRGGLSFRELGTRYRRALQSMAPCFLMSPGSVAHYLPGDFTFDVVVFDEASQIRVSQSIGALGRGRSAVITGDSKQMPPTRVMEVNTANIVDLGDDVGEDPAVDEVVIEDLESILDESVESGLPREWLTWHYRSHDERLIAFSNNTYYQGRLVTLPSPRVPGGHPDESATGLEWRRVDGVFDRGRTRTNEVEARAIVETISGLLADPATRSDSIGVVTFNIQQRDLILDLLEDSTDLQIKAAMERPAGEAIFVKNLESVQGDERDVVLFSLAFSKDASGRLPLQFGPLILAGGERRLNVAITRARKRVVLFSSFDPRDIDLSRTNSQGLRDLRSYLEFARGGDLPQPRIADGSAPPPAARTDEFAAEARSALVTALRESLESRGYVVEDGVGLSRFKVDLAVRKPEDKAGWRVAVIADGPGWASLPTVADREGAPVLLETIMHWPAVERVWLPAWLRNRDDVVSHLVELVDRTTPFDPKSNSADATTAEAEDTTVAALTAANRAEEGGVDTAALSPAPRLPATAPEAPTEASAEASIVVAAASGSALLGRTSSGDAGAGSGFTRFEAAEVTAVGHAATLDNPRLAVPAITRYADEILAVEGPVAAERLARLIGARFGLSRVVERRRNDILGIVTQSHATTEGGGFVWPRDVEPKSWTDIARTNPEGTRTLAEVSLHELVNGMVILLRQAFSMTEDELATETVRAFGFVRVTPAVRNRIDKAIALGVDARRLRREGGRVETTD